MRVLMISLDRGLFGEGYSGDVLMRHLKYARAAGSLDIIVFAPKEVEDKAMGSNLRIFSTKSGKIFHFRKATDLARKLGSENQYDLLVTQEFAAPSGFKIKKTLGIPWIVNIHGMFFSSGWLKFNLLNWYLFYRIKDAVKFADGFRVNNKLIEAKLRDWGIQKPILVQPTPIDISKFFPSSPQPSPSREGEGGRVRVLYVGRFSPEKNVAMLIRAVKNINADFELRIVGTGPEEQRLRKIAGADPRIKFLGPKTYDQLPPIFQAADIFVLSSNTESFGQVLWQAQAAGCAIIATRTAGAMSIIKDGENGILIETGDETGLEHALEKLISDSNLMQNLSREALLSAQKYNAQGAIERTINFWKEIVKG